MKIKTTSFHESIRIGGGIEDGPARPVQYSKNPTRYKVESFHMIFTRLVDIEWTLKEVSLHGTKLRKNGELSNTRYAERFNGWDWTRMPAWVQEIVQAHFPKDGQPCHGEPIEMETDADA